MVITLTIMESMRAIFVVFRRLVPMGLLAVIALPTASAAPTLAYLDPGTGAVLLQSLLALFMGLVVAVGVWWTRFKMFVGKLFGRGNVEDDE
jgi:hypothetical protein